MSSAVFGRLGRAVFSPMNAIKAALAVEILSVVTVSPVARAESVAEALTAEAARQRLRLEKLTSTALVDSERPRLKALIDDVDALVKARRFFAATETLSSAAPGVAALARAASGWDDTGKGPGKHVEDLQKEWAEVGKFLKSDRLRFPKTKPAGQTAFERAMAEQSFGQIDEHYAVAVDYGRFSGVSSGAYYLGRAEGHLAWALTLSGWAFEKPKPATALPSLEGRLKQLEGEIVTAYAKPGSTAQHANFILANSSLKLAKELNASGNRFGSLSTLLRSLFSLALATTPAPPPEGPEALNAAFVWFDVRFRTLGVDETIGLAFLEKADLALQKSIAGGEGSERERLRAAALLLAVLPRYMEIMEDFRK